MIDNDQHEWSGEDRRRSAQPDTADWYKYKFMIMDKLEGLEKKVTSIEDTVGEFKISFVKLQTKIMMVSGLSGFVSAAVITAIFTALADKLIK